MPQLIRTLMSPRAPGPLQCLTVSPGLSIVFESLARDGDEVVGLNE